MRNMCRVSLEKVTVSTSIDNIYDIIDRDGAVIITDILSSKESHDLTSELDAHFNITPFCDGLFFGNKTKRVHSLVAKSKICRQIVLLPLIIQIMNHLLGPSCNRIQLNLTQGIQIWPGERPQILHRDDTMFPVSVRSCELMVNAMWACTDFTPDNGATVVVPGSHKWSDPNRKPKDGEITQAEMNAGDVLLYAGSLIHGGGENRSTLPRAGVVFGYCLGWLRQYENQYLAVPPQIAETFSKDLQDLLGYAVHRPNLGMYEGNEPNILFNKNANVRAVTKDWLTPEQEKNLREYCK